MSTSFQSIERKDGQVTLLLGNELHEQQAIEICVPALVADVHVTRDVRVGQLLADPCLSNVD